MGKMRDSNLLKWTQNNKNNKLVEGKEKKVKKSKEDKNKNWLHKPESLTSGHIAYLVKFLGSTEVDQAKGIDVVKEGIRKLKFSQQIKKAEGEKTPKVELTVSVDGVAIQEPKSKKIQHQYPLNRISYCADDKAEKRFFSFIAKESDSDKHTCFVFVSDKLAEEITLTIGQAFDLAYKRFLSGKVESESEKISRLERENSELRQRLSDLGNLMEKSKLTEYMEKNDIADLAVVGEALDNQDSQDGDKEISDSNADVTENTAVNDNQNDKLINFDIPSTKLDTMTLDDLNDDDFDPRAADHTGDSSDTSDDFNPRALATSPPVRIAPLPSSPVRIAPPPRSTITTPQIAPPTVVPRDPTKVSAKPTNPFTAPAPNNDPFGMASFSATATKQTPSGLATNPIYPSLGNSDFSLDELDPLKK